MREELLKNRRAFLLDCNELDYNEQFMGRMAANCALKSKDSTKVGAIIYRGEEIISRGYNHLIDGIEESNFTIDEDNKSKVTIHAEMKAITDLARRGVSAEGSSIIITGKCPCSDCAKAIVMSGIKEVICPIPDTNSRWSGENNVAMVLLLQSGISLRMVRELTGTEIGLTCPTKYII